MPLASLEGKQQAVSLSLSAYQLFRVDRLTVTKEDDNENLLRTNNA